MAWRTGAAWGLTDTRSAAWSCENHSADMMLTIDADEAWWPPTLTPEAVLRTLLAWWTCVAASHSTRRCTRSRAASPPRAAACTVMPAVNLAAPPDATSRGRVRHHA